MKVNTFVFLLDHLIPIKPIETEGSFFLVVLAEKSNSNHLLQDLRVIESLVFLMLASRMIFEPKTYIYRL